MKYVDRDFKTEDQRRSVRSPEMRLLDNRWISRTGNAFFLVGAALFVFGWIKNDPETALTLVLLGIGVALIAAPRVPRVIERFRRSAPPREKAVRVLRRPTPQIRSPERPHQATQAKVEEALAKRTLEREIVALIDEWKLVRHDTFTGTDFGTYSLWEERTSKFIGSALGEVERSRFQSNGDETNLSLERQATLRIRALERLRDNQSDWRLLGKRRDDIRAAIKARRELEPQDQIVLAGTPSLAKRYANDVGPPQESEESPGEAGDDSDQAGPDISDEFQSSAPVAGGLKESLEAEREHGRRLLNALSAGLAGSWQYQRVPQGSDVDGWEANVDHLLRDQKDMRDLFHYEPLEPAIRGVLPNLADGLFHGPERRRLKRRLNQLDRVIERV